MEEDSVKAAAASSNDKAAVGSSPATAKRGKEQGGVIEKSNNGAKRGRFDRCFSFAEISIDPGVKSLKQLDSKKFKEDIKRWAKRVAAYSRQLSDHFGSSRH